MVKGKAPPGQLVPRQTTKTVAHVTGVVGAAALKAQRVQADADRQHIISNTARVRVRMCRPLHPRLAGAFQGADRRYDSWKLEETLHLCKQDHVEKIELHQWTCGAPATKATTLMAVELPSLRAKVR